MKGWQGNGDLGFHGVRSFWLMVESFHGFYEAVVEVVVWLCVFGYAPIKKGLQTFVRRTNGGLQAPSDTWSFRLVLVPGSLEFLDPVGFRLPEFGV